LGITLKQAYEVCKGENDMTVFDNISEEEQDILGENCQT
jgi:hypothetical protein